MKKKELAWRLVRSSDSEEIRGPPLESSRNGEAVGEKKTSK